MIIDLLVPFLTVGIAELADKTQLLIFFLASRTTKRLQLLFGALLAFAIIHGLTIAFGGYVRTLVPGRILEAMAGIIFIVFGLYTMVVGGNNHKEYRIKNTFLSALGLVLLAEFGDKSQIASGLFALKYNPWLVFLGVMVALALLSGLGIIFGKFMAEKIDRKKFSIVAGIFFIVIGILVFV